MHTEENGMLKILNEFSRWLCVGLSSGPAKLVQAGGPEWCLQVCMMIKLDKDLAYVHVLNTVTVCMALVELCHATFEMAQLT